MRPYRSGEELSRKRFDGKIRIFFTTSNPVNINVVRQLKSVEAHLNEKETKGENSPGCSKTLEKGETKKVSIFLPLYVKSPFRRERSIGPL